MAQPVVLVTGGNKGLGYAAVEVMAERQPGWTYILTSRDAKAGAEAAEAILKKTNVHVDVQELEVTNDDHINKVVKYVEEKHGRLDVLVNNAGILAPPQWESMSLREIMNTTLNVNLTSVAVLTTQFMPLLHKSADPKVVTVTSGISSVTNLLTKPVARSITYGGSKTGLNGMTMQMQAQEWDRVNKPAAEQAAAGAKDAAAAGAPPIRFYVCQPGVTRTSFTRHTRGKDPREGAEVLVRLALDVAKTYPGGTYWQFEEGQMSEVPW